MSNFFEGLEKNDLSRTISTTITIDKFVSKLGSDADVLTVGIKAEYKEPAFDLEVEHTKNYVVTDKKIIICYYIIAC
jgi:hypothetical protein